MGEEASGILRMLLSRPQRTHFNTEGRTFLIMAQNDLLLEFNKHAAI